MPEIEIPEGLEELLEETSVFRRRLAVVVVLVTLFGATIAYLHDVESNLEENSAQEAARAAVDGLADQGRATDENSLQLGHVFQRQLIDAAKRSADGSELEQLQDTPADVDLQADADRLAKISDSLQAEGDASEFDQIPGLVAAKQQESFKAQLVNTVRAEQANDHGNKADAYVAVLAIVAVGLFLVGLSLTIEAKGRYYLAVPGVVIILVCALWSLSIAQRGALTVSSKAIDLTAEGQALVFQNKLEDAKARYDEAIKDSPEFADAYLQRSGVLLALGNRNPDGLFNSVVDPELAKQAVEDGERAIALGKGDDVNAIIDVGFANFLVGDDKRTEELSRHLTEISPTNPLGFFNLGVALVAQGDEKGANKAYDSALDLVEKIGEGDDLVAPALLASARTDLEVVVARQDKADQDLIRAIKGRLVAKELSLDPLFDGDPQVSDNPSLDGDVGITQALDRLTVSFDVADMAVDDALSVVVNFRRSGAPEDEAFVSLPFRSFNATLTQAEIDQGFQFTIPTTECLEAGTYRIEVFSGDKFLGENSSDIAEGPFGKLRSDFTDLSDTSVCRPASWSVDALADNADARGVAYRDPATDASMIVRLYRPLDADASKAQAELLDEILQTAGVDDDNTTLANGSLDAPTDGDPVAVNLDDGSRVCLPSRVASGTAEVGDNGTQANILVVAVQGADTVLRVVIFAAPDQETVDSMATELLPRLSFQRTGVDDQAADCPT